MDLIGKVEGLQATLTTEVAIKGGQVAFWAELWPGMLAVATQGADMLLNREVAKANTWLAKEQVQTRRSHAGRQHAAMTELRSLADRLAPAGLGLPWGSAGWPDPGPDMGGCVRVGELALGPDAVPMPFLVPLVDAPGFSLRSTPSIFVETLHSILLRALVTFGPEMVRVHSFDPELITDLGAFAAVRQVDKFAIPAAITTSTDLVEMLERIGTHLAETEDGLSASGFKSILEEASDSGRLIRPLHILVLGGALGTAIGEEALGQLAQILRVGGPRGLFVLAREDAMLSLFPGARPLLPLMTVRGNALEISSLPGQVGTVDRAPRTEAVAHVCDALRRRPRASNAPTLPLRELIEAIESPWLDPGDFGIETVFGRSGRNDLSLRLRSSNPPQPNAIVGGAVGQGKSSLLLTLIMGFAAKYSPVDLEMVLLDLKDGVEFSPFGPDSQGRNWLPHVRVLGLEFDQAFAIAVLEWLVDQVRVRGGAMRQAGTKDIATHRAATGEQMPRVLVVIDEFQRLFEGDDEHVDRGVRALESLARTGRSAGIHLLLSSQTISGLRGLGAKADAVFSQFHNRLSMKNTKVESQAILAAGNTAAASLTHRGEVIAHEAMGEDPGLNTRGLSAYADPAYARELQRDLWVQGSTGIPPKIFHASCFAPKPPTPSPRSGNALVSLSPGAPISATEEARLVTLNRSPNQTVAVIGQETGTAGRVLLSMIGDVLQERADRQVVVLDALSRPGHEHPLSAAVMLMLASTRHRRFGRSELVTAIGSVLADPATPLLLICLGLDNAPEIEELDPTSFLEPAEGLRQVFRDSAIHSSVVLGWWQSLSRLEAQLGFGMPSVRAAALCGMGREDIQSVAGHAAGVPEGNPRFTWWDRNASGPETLIPFEVPARLRAVLDA